MKLRGPLMVVVLTLCATTAWGQKTTSRVPHIGYLYPAGGQQGTTRLVTVGGQLLRGAKAVYISGTGVHGKVLRYYRPPKNMQREQRDELIDKLRAARDKRLAALPKNSKIRVAFEGKGLARRQPSAKATATQSTPAKKPATATQSTPAKKPATAKQSTPAKKPATATKSKFRSYDHPLLYNLEDQNLRQLVNTAYELFFPRNKKQVNPQLGEMVVIEIKIDPDAQPGNRELRIETPVGLSNPVVIQVGQYPEVDELEPNCPMTDGSQSYIARLQDLPRPLPLDLPLCINGQIMPGDSDRFRFRARRGQNLVFEVYARRLIPFLADAVPGWFQATLALYNIQGKEVAFKDDYEFSPDPVMHYKVPEDGVYVLEIRDAIYRGREDFVYRIVVGEHPFVTAMYPLGGRAGSPVSAKLTGWNLAKSKIPLDTKPGVDRIRRRTIRENKLYADPVLYAVDTLPESDEHEPNDSIRKAQRVELPIIINGRIDAPGDVDVFRFKGRADTEIVLDVCARRLHSALDSLVRITDAKGNVIGWNDDNMIMDGFMHPDMGLLTHHADSYVIAKLPKNGVYYAHLSDSGQHGGDDYGYRLRISEPIPDFALRVTPSTVNVPAGRSVPLKVYILRKDGFDGPVKLALKNAPVGFSLDGATIPAGRDSVRVTLTAPSKSTAQPVLLHMEGRARVDGTTIVREAIPSEDVMQAFLWRHLAPSQQFVASVRKPLYMAKLFQLADTKPVRVPVGGQTQVRLTTPRNTRIKKIDLTLNEPPKGLSLDNATITSKGIEFSLKADKKTATAGLADNLIVEVFANVSYGKKGASKTRRVPLGYLPAIPFEIVK